jgi:hypothetical protein
LEGLVYKGNICLSEKLKIVNFMKIVHLRLSQINIRFYSEIIPLNIYLLNEFFPSHEISKEERKSFIPVSLLEIVNFLVEKMKKNYYFVKIEDFLILE